MNLSLPQHTVSDIDNIINAANTACNNVQVHLSHPNMYIKLNHLRILHTSMRPSNTYKISHHVIYYRIFISERSPLIHRDRFLSLTMDNTTHTLTPRGTEAPPISQHFLRLFLNPCKRSSYPQYTYRGGHHNNLTVSAQRLTITTSFPSSTISSR